MTAAVRPRETTVAHIVERFKVGNEQTDLQAVVGVQQEMDY